MQLTRSGHPNPHTLLESSIIWLSRSYGYNDELIYYFPILSGFSDSFKNTQIAVDYKFPINRYPTLPLRPILRHFNMTNLPIPGASYDGTISLPTMKTIWRIFRS